MPFPDVVVGYYNRSRLKLSCACQITLYTIVYMQFDFLPPFITLACTSTLNVLTTTEYVVQGLFGCTAIQCALALIILSHYAIRCLERSLPLNSRRDILLSSLELERQCSSR